MSASPPVLPGTDSPGPEHDPDGATGPFRRSGLSAPSRRRSLWIASLLLVAYPLYWLGTRADVLLKAATILYAIDGQRPPRALRIYTQLRGDNFETRDLAIPGKYGPIPVRVYSPHDRPHAPVMVFIHGMTPLGYRDSIMVRMSKSMAQAGLRVITPDIRSEQQVMMRFDEISDIDEVVRWAAKQSGRRVSLMGVSFSGGLVVAAAAQPGYADDLKTVLSVSGYNDISRLGRYYVQHREAGPDDQSDPVKPPPESPLFIAVQYLPEMVPAGDISAIRKVALDRLRKQPEKEREDFKLLTPAQRKLFLELQVLDTPQIREKYLALLERHNAELSAISPHASIGGLRAPLYLLHGEIDPTIPLSEAEWNVHDAPKGVPVHLFVSPIMHHVVLDDHPPRMQKLKLANFMAGMLSATGLR